MVEERVVKMITVKYLATSLTLTFLLCILCGCVAIMYRDLYRLLE